MTAFLRRIDEWAAFPHRDQHALTEQSARATV
jgi:hypothetical protein